MAVGVKKFVTKLLLGVLKSFTPPIDPSDARLIQLSVLN